VCGRMVPKSRLFCCALKALCVWECVRALFIVWSMSVPAPQDDPTLLVLDKYGGVLHQTLSFNRTMRTLYGDLKQIDKRFVKALVLIEDKRFFSHKGVDVFALMRAFIQWFDKGKIVSGASTITMQTARLLYPHTKTFLNKVKECFYAWHLERIYSKQEILSLYLLRAPYGGNIEGVRAASFAYFNHDADVLCGDEIALLLALPRMPAAIRPQCHYAQALHERNRMLNKLESLWIISAKEACECRGIAVPKTLYPIPKYVPHISMRLKKMGQSGSQKTYLCPDIQHQVEKVLQHKTPFNKAVIVIDHLLHQVVAYVGSDNFWDTYKKGQFDFVTAMRSPGSTLKPFVYGMAMDRGLIARDTLMLDIKRSYGSYCPHNFDKKLRNWLSAEDALRLSLNTPVVHLMQKVGVCNFVDNIKSSGALFSFPGEANLSIALGGCATNLESLAILYGVFVNNGWSYPVFYTHDMTKGSKAHMLSAESVEELWKMLEVTRLSDGRSLFVKTGTSYGHNDAWCIGVDGRFVVAVWCGYPDNAGLNYETGGSVAFPLVEKIFSFLPRTAESFCEERRLSPGSIMREVLSHEEKDANITIEFPFNDSSISLAKTKEEGGLPIQIRNAKGKLSFFVNGSYGLVKEQEGQYVWNPLKEGFYTLTAQDAKGQSASVRIRVLP